MLAHLTKQSAPTVLISLGGLFLLQTGHTCGVRKISDYKMQSHRDDLFITAVTCFTNLSSIGATCSHHPETLNLQGQVTPINKANLGFVFNIKLILNFQASNYK